VDPFIIHHGDTMAITANEIAKTLKKNIVFLFLKQKIPIPTIEIIVKVIAK